MHSASSASIFLLISFFRLHFVCFVRFRCCFFVCIFQGKRRERNRDRGRGRDRRKHPLTPPHRRRNHLSRAAPQLVHSWRWVGGVWAGGVCEGVVSAIWGKSAWRFAKQQIAVDASERRGEWEWEWEWEWQWQVSGEESGEMSGEKSNEMSNEMSGEERSTRGVVE